MGMHDDSMVPAFELDPDTLKAAEFLQVRAFLDSIVGKTIASTAIDHESASITTTDGTTLVFCQFGGAEPTESRG